MPYLILFQDAPDHDHVRSEKMPAHLAFLSSNAGTIRAAGPLMDGDAGAGGAWIVDVADADAAWHLIKTDPFWSTGLRRSVKVLRWHQVFADGRVV